VIDACNARHDFPDRKKTPRFMQSCHAVDACRATHARGAADPPPRFDSPVEERAAPENIFHGRRRLRVAQADLRRIAQAFQRRRQARAHADRRKKTGGVACPGLLPAMRAPRTWRPGDAFA